ncbi:tellurite resistance TerB family protein [Neolewinella antarctica]|uniref:Tellurite resistance protein n=1 Tax=Neolewinella antarctica TaxID=442734 RepID=A0ABX0XHY4_9BACT|nr:TerB N-terminal domain-containing protein [Neolewinella antarctica]NJC28337.1 tellurite resistance protein [Neolewinella antarctica]
MTLFFTLLGLYILYRIFLKGKEAGPDSYQPPSADESTRSFENIGFDNTMGGDDVSYDIAENFASSRQNRRADQPRWVPFGSTTEVHGRNLPGGVYVGVIDDPYRYSLTRYYIDPEENVSSSKFGGDLSYWPRYSYMEPGLRGAYLDWLGSGARNTDAQTGFVFLYFYGLEYRRFYDQPTEADRRKIREEVIRLLVVFGDRPSVNHYLSDFLFADQFQRGDGIPFYESIPRYAEQYEIDIPTRLALSQVAKDGVALPSTWALKLALTHESVSWTTVMRRCLPELQELFAVRYAEAHGDGMTLKENKSKLSITYKAAAGEFSKELLPGNNLRNTARLANMAKSLGDIVQDCVTELDRYSRFIGKSPEAIGTKAAYALLPQEIAADRVRKLDDPLIHWLKEQVPDAGNVVIPACELLDRYDDRQSARLQSGSLKKSANIGLCSLLEMLDIAIVPDIRLGERKLSVDSSVVLYKEMKPLDIAPSSDYVIAATTLKILATVAAGDGLIHDDELAQMSEYVAKSSVPTDQERRRLHALVNYYTAAPPTLGSATKEISHTLAQRRIVADAALRVAMADGSLEKVELKMMRKLYSVLGLAESEIFNDINSLKQRQSNNTKYLPPISDEPVVVRQAPPNRAKGISVPPYTPQEETTKEIIAEPGLSLDFSIIAAKRAETARAANLLASIFEEELEEEMEESENTADNRDTNAGKLIAGLDVKHSNLIKLIFELKSPSGEVPFVKLSEEGGLMPGGAMETINEWGFEKFDDFILNDDEDVALNPDILPQLKSLLLESA